MRNYIKYALTKLQLTIEDEKKAKAKEQAENQRKGVSQRTWLLCDKFKFIDE